MPITKLRHSELSTTYHFNLVQKKSNTCQATFSCFKNVDSIDEENYAQRVLNYKDISVIANNKYGYHYNNSDTIFDICGSRKHLEQHITSYLERHEVDKNKTLTSIINIHNAHWVAMVISYRNNQYYAYYIDSLGNEINQAVYKSLNIFNIHNIAFSTTEQQTDGYNCGLWALENAYYINNVIKDYEPYFNTENFMLPKIDAEYFVQIREKYLFDDNNI